MHGTINFEVYMVSLVYVCDVWLQAHAQDNVETNDLDNHIWAELYWWQIVHKSRLSFESHLMSKLPVVFAVWLQVYDCGNFDIHSLGIHTADTTDTMNSTCMTIPWT